MKWTYQQNVVASFVFSGNTERLCREQLLAPGVPRQLALLMNLEEILLPLLHFCRQHLETEAGSLYIYIEA